MGTSRFWVVMSLLLTCKAVHAEEWTVNGKDYHNVKVGLVEADRVHITYDGGLGTVTLSDLSPELQKRFSYDPHQANASTHARDKARSEAQREAAAEHASISASQNNSQKSLSPVQIAAIQARIDRLESDISKCQQKQATLTQQELLGSGWQYGEEIRQDRLAIKELKAQIQ